MNLRGMTKKLQTALCNRGEYYKINQKQTYSPKTNRMITKYVLIHSKQVGDKTKNTTVLETYKIQELVKKLAEIYRGGSG